MPTFWLTVLPFSFFNTPAITITSTMEPTLNKLMSLSMQTVNAFQVELMPMDTLHNKLAILSKKITLFFRRLLWWVLYEFTKLSQLKVCTDNMMCQHGCQIWILFITSAKATTFCVDNTRCVHLDARFGFINNNCNSNILNSRPI